MKRKRMIKLLMAMGCDRNDAVRAADMCDGNNSHIRTLLRLIRSCCDMMYGEEVSGGYLRHTFWRADRPCS